MLEFLWVCLLCALNSTSCQRIWPARLIKRYVSWAKKNPPQNPEAKPTQSLVRCRMEKEVKEWSTDEIAHSISKHFYPDVSCARSTCEQRHSYTYIVIYMYVGRYKQKGCTCFSRIVFAFALRVFKYLHTKSFQKYNLNNQQIFACTSQYFSFFLFYLYQFWSEKHSKSSQIYISTGTARVAAATAIL